LSARADHAADDARFVHLAFRHIERFYHRASRMMVMRSATYAISLACAK
jgi:hypothetical protein